MLFIQITLSPVKLSLHRQIIPISQISTFPNFQFSKLQ